MRGLVVFLALSPCVAPDAPASGREPLAAAAAGVFFAPPSLPPPGPPLEEVEQDAAGSGPEPQVAAVPSAAPSPAAVLPSTPSRASVALESLVQLALESHPELQALRQQVLAAEQRPAQARALPDPTADIELMNLSVDKPRIGDALTEGISVGLTQEIPWPGKRGVAASMARSEAEVAKARLVARESMIRGEVIGAAFEMVMLDRLLELNDETRQALEEAARTAAAIYASGMGTQADILLAQTTVTRTLTAREGLEARREIARARLESLLGGPGEAALLPESLLSALILPDPGLLPPLESLLAELPETSPEVLMGRAEEQVRWKAVEMARLDFKPDLMVGGRYRFRDMSMGGGDFLTAMVGVTLPFFHRRDRYRPALEEARLRQEGARRETEAALVESRYALAEAWRRADRDRRLHGLYRDGLLIQASQAYESTLAVYSVGRADFPSLLMTLTELYDVQGEVVMAQAGFQESMAMIEAALGHPLPTEGSPEGSGGGEESAPAVRDPANGEGKVSADHGKAAVSSDPTGGDLAAPAEGIDPGGPAGEHGQAGPTTGIEEE